jgi:hypothetical protein
MITATRGKRERVRMFEAGKLRRQAENTQRFVRKCLAVAGFFMNPHKSVFIHVKKASYCGFSIVMLSKRDFLVGYLEGMETVRRLTIVFIERK